MIAAGLLAPPKNNPREFALEVLAQVFSSVFSSRVNMNLREDKHWTYGARGQPRAARGPREYAVYAPVQTDKTKDAMAELAKEFRAIAGERPPTPEEVKAAQARLTLALGGLYETNAAANAAIREMLAVGHPDDYWETYAEKVRAVTAEEAAGVAESLIKPEALVWVVVGDRARIEAGIRELGIGEVQIVEVE
jgi:zinc protease